MKNVLFTKIFHHGVGNHSFLPKEGNQSWSEPPILDTDPYYSQEVNDLGYMALPSDVAEKNPPTDTILADLAIETLDNLEKIETDDPFFLAVGFR